MKGTVPIRNEKPKVCQPERKTMNWRIRVVEGLTPLPCYPIFTIYENTTNPLQINLGEGRIGIAPFSDDGEHGLILSDSGEPHEIGELSGSEPGREHYPQQGEVFIRCANRESALVLMEQVCRVVAAFTTDELRESS